MAKVASAVAAALVLVIMVVAAGVTGLLSAFGGQSSRPSATAIADIPGEYLNLYRQAAITCPGLDWSVLAAIGKVESDHGRSTLPGVRSGANQAGARGPMQFIDSTFTQVTAGHELPQSGTRRPSPYNAQDAIYAAAAYLCDSGARNGRDLHRAIYTYNHADWYVSKVLAQARSYRGTASTAPIPAASLAIAYARAQVGLPYVWGGDGPAAGAPGFDCSGLTKAAYAAAGVSLPRTAQQQYDAGPQVPSGEPLVPGDLLFYGHPRSAIHHVGLYIGDGRMIDAPGRGKTIRTGPFRYAGDDYTGATRP
ncbi:C40 family peptidase [Streptomyces sp. NPDC020719]|uniref:C40 family peptidase n=1 Tax=Streptomyces sp. NPDC020719 TaxID=3154896 RepID=UPI00340EF28E